MAKKKVTPKTPSRAGNAPASPIDLRLLQQITQLMKENDLNIIEVRDGDRRVMLQRGANIVSGVSVGHLQSAPVAGASSNPATEGAAPATNESANLTPIKSPMVGTFYAAASPDAKPFVSVGSTVNEETDVCIIEAMKVFNNIKAECQGTIAKILVESGATVEFGQPLFLVKPA